MEIGIQVKMKSEFIAIAHNDVNQGDELIVILPFNKSLPPTTIEQFNENDYDYFWIVTSDFSLHVTNGTQFITSECLLTSMNLFPFFILFRDSFCYLIENPITVCLIKWWKNRNMPFYVNEIIMFKHAYEFNLFFCK